MNRTVTPNYASITASTWFAEYLQRKVLTKRDACNLAKAIGMERKAIYAYAYLERTPKLEVVAKIMAYYGEDFIKIPLKDLNFYSIGDGKK